MTSKNIINKALCYMSDDIFHPYISETLITYWFQFLKFWIQGQQANNAVLTEKFNEMESCDDSIICILWL